MLYLIDLRLNDILKDFVSIEVERFTRNIVNKKVDSMFSNNELKDYFKIISLENNYDRVTYNTKEINDLLSYISSSIYLELKNLENGDIDDFFIPKRISNGKYKKVKNGVLFDCSLSSIRGSSIFGNIGPSVPLKLLFVGQVNSNIDVKTKEYGINNVMVEIYIVIEVKEEVVMPVSSKQKTIIIKKPVSIDIIRGEIPNYYNTYSAK